MNYIININKLLDNLLFVALVLVLFRGQTKFIYVTNLLFLVIILIFGIRVVQNKIKIKNWIWQKWIIMFLAWGVISYTWTFYGRNEKGYYFVFFALIFVSIINVEENFWIRLMRWTTAFSNIIAVSIYLEAISPSLFIKIFGWILALPANALKSANLGEYTGILGGNQQAAVFLNIGIVAHLARCYANRKIDRKSLFYILIYLLAIILTSKRMLTVIPLIVFMVYYFMSATKNKYSKFFVTMFFAFVIAYIGINLEPDLSVKFLTYFSGEGDNDLLSGRGAFWKGCQQMFAEEPIHGYGLASFNGVYYEKTHYLFHGEPWIYHAHNIYYQMMAELGIIGIAFFLIQAVKVVNVVYRFNTNKKKFTQEQAIILFWCMGIIITLLLYGLTGNILYNSEEICWYVFALNGIGYIAVSTKKKSY